MKNNASQDANAKINKKHKKKKRRQYFKIALLIYSALLVITIFTVWIILWGRLSGYQKNIDNEQAAAEMDKQEKRAPQLFITNAVDTFSKDDWISLWTNNSSGLDKEDDINSVIETTILSSPLSLWKAPDYSDSNLAYLVTNDNGDIARLHITKSNETYMIDAGEILINGEFDSQITVPKSCEVYCNNILLDESYISDDSGSMSNDLKDYEDSLINPTAYCTYSVNGLLSEPELTVANGDDSFTINTDSNGDYYLVLNDSGTYKNEAESFVKSLLYYYSQGKNSASANMASATSHVASGSSAQSIIRQSLDGVLWRYPTNATYETVASDVYVIADNCYFVDIYYKETGADEDSTQIYRVYFLDLGSGFKIYSFAMM